MLLMLAAASFLCAGFLDVIRVAGIGLPIHWLRDMAMVAAGVVCLQLLVRFRNVR